MRTDRHITAVERTALEHAREDRRVGVERVARIMSICGCDERRARWLLLWSRQHRGKHQARQP
jgi:hypothetical protein